MSRVKKKHVSIYSYGLLFLNTWQPSYKLPQQLFYKNAHLSINLVLAQFFSFFFSFFNPVLSSRTQLVFLKRKENKKIYQNWAELNQSSHEY